MNDTAETAPPLIPGTASVINPTGSVVAVVWARIPVTEVSKMPAASRRAFGVEGVMIVFFITASGWFKAEIARRVGM